MSKKYLLSTIVFTLLLTACGQKGALYLPKDTASELPTPTADTSDISNNPNDLTNVQSPNQITPTIDPTRQNPNVTQDKKNDY